MAGLSRGLLLAILLVAGCASPATQREDPASGVSLPPFSIEGAELVATDASSSTFLWRGVIGPAPPVSPPFLPVGLPGAVASAVPSPSDQVLLPFRPPLGVAFQIEGALEGAGIRESFVGMDILGNGTRQCTSAIIGGPEWAPACTTRIYDPLDEPEEWALSVRSGSNSEPLEFEFTVRVRASMAPLAGEPPALVAYRGNEVVDVPEEFRALSFRPSFTGVRHGEPTVGVTSDGTIFTPALYDELPQTPAGAPRSPVRQWEVARSRDGGHTWDRVHHPALSPITNYDTWVWVDPLTDRMFNVALYIECSWAQWTDDGGATWDASPAAGCGLPQHDHETLTTGPPAPGTVTLGYDNVVYYSYSSSRNVGDAGAFVTVSLDGGRSWGPGVRVHPSDCTSGSSGGVGVAPDGTAYSAHGGCEGVFVAVSHDSGATWGEPVLAGSHHPLFSDPDLGFDREGRAYLAHSDAMLGVSLATSDDGGLTWPQDVDVMPPELGRALFPVIAVGEPGRVGIAYLATTADGATWPREGDPSYAPDATVWHLYVTYSLDALSDDPTWVTYRVTPDDDPVQMGCVWMHGGDAECRNLLDFMDSTQHGGMLYVAHADGCDACERAARPQVVGGNIVWIQTGGPSLGPAWWDDRGQTPSPSRRASAPQDTYISGRSVANR